MSIKSRAVRCVLFARLNRRRLDGALAHPLRPLGGRPLSTIGIDCAVILAGALASAAGSVHCVSRFGRTHLPEGSTFAASRGGAAFAA